MSEKSIRVGGYEFVPTDPLMSFDEVVDLINYQILSEIRASPVLSDVYDFFNSKKKPLKPMEFLDFWNSLEWEEHGYYIHATTKPLPPPTGIRGVMQSLENPNRPAL